MSILAMPPQHHHRRYHPDFHQELSWQESHPEPLPRPPLYEQQKITLPSIHQAFPGFQLEAQRENVARTPPTAVSPTGAQYDGTMTPPEYIHSPRQLKRRRLSFETETLRDRSSQVPRLYGTQPVRSRPQSPVSRTRPAVPPLWTNSNHPSPFGTNGALPSMVSPVSVETHERAEKRPTLPALPLLNFERSVAEPHRPPPTHATEDYLRESSKRSGLASSSGRSVEAASHEYPPTSYSYGYSHPSRPHSLSVGATHPLDRTPFSSGPYGPPFHETFMRIGEFGIGMSGDSKQRKRRGNLPKETTDKLRAWFVAHLHHPYPTEDEKQDLMRQTGLQMNQISNWFINARRRQLPTMINNARAESEAMNGRTGDNKISASPERVDLEQESKNNSDSEGSNYDEVDIVKRHRSNNLKRGSI
ncbi:hypothetical protein F5Y16DRAFT_182698 [Xylariaceae sp. FL0255]|nr:hypothetical protein F5Y16DRAFT_182698 [Xylariaceae sp. FL0255]